MHRIRSRRDDDSTDSFLAERRTRKGANLPIGTIIATFDVNGRYGNHLDGSSHGAIYLGQNAHGILVLDQWKGHSTTQPVHERLIRFKKGTGIKVDDGDQYYVVD
ncbi:BPSL0067 family protein [Acidocella sp. MX-AZ03]|uniref:BPSL0067 family protein n=1 Tax=Acidocella sp. MX-AZ03 TaxID=2697363 RepID=UPI0022DE565C|nr:BPSL0067 family protein [Acidocella sp. MX-AZ03]WBO60758.1 BPSL0067 family protein [Acidocella sp. MX-AZ03]